MCIIHKWGEWDEHIGNAHPWSHPKFQERQCLKCYDREMRPMPSLEQRIVAMFENGYSEDSVNKALEIFKKEYGVARFTRITKDWAKF